MKKYKELYFEQKEKTEYWIRKYEEILAEKEVEPYCVIICFKNGESKDIVDVIKHEVNHTNCHPFYNPENWKITTADGLVSIFKYDEVKYILAYRKVEE